MSAARSASLLDTAHPVPVSVAQTDPGPPHERCRNNNEEVQSALIKLIVVFTECLKRDNFELKSLCHIFCTKKIFFELKSLCHADPPPAKLKKCVMREKL